MMGLNTALKSGRWWEIQGCNKEKRTDTNILTEEWVGLSDLERQDVSRDRHELVVRGSQHQEDQWWSLEEDECRQERASCCHISADKRVEECVWNEVFGFHCPVNSAVKMLRVPKRATTVWNSRPGLTSSMWRRDSAKMVQGALMDGWTGDGKWGFSGVNPHGLNRV